MKMLDLYKSILSTGGLSVDKDGMVSAKAGNTVIPFTVKGKRLVLPTKEHLSNSDWENRVIFHPLSENVLRAESDVMSRFRSAINTRMNYVLGCVMEELMTLATSVKMHSNLDPDQSKVLSVLKNADEKTLNALQSILKAMSVDSNKDKSIVHIYLKRGGTVGGKKYDRAAIVSFPLYEEILKSDKSVYGVTLRSKDKLSIQHLLEFIFPGIQTENSFNRGSFSDVAPFLDSLMKAVMALACSINTIVDEYDKILSEPEDFRYADDWVSVFDNLAQLLPEIRTVPMQAGNEGSIENKQQAQVVQPQAAVASPVAQPAPGTLAWNPNAVQPQVQQYQAPAPIQNNNGSSIVRSSGGIDFSASVRNNPQLSQALNYNQGYMQPQMQQPQRPRWDGPQYGSPQGMGYGPGSFPIVGQQNGLATGSI
jgi:hypothetical protein